MPRSQPQLGGRPSPLVRNELAEGAHLSHGRGACSRWYLLEGLFANDYRGGRQLSEGGPIDRSRFRHHFAKAAQQVFLTATGACASY